MQQRTRKTLPVASKGNIHALRQNSIYCQNENSSSEICPRHKIQNIQHGQLHSIPIMLQNRQGTTAKSIASLSTMILNGHLRCSKLSTFFVLFCLLFNTQIIICNAKTAPTSFASTKEETKHNKEERETFSVLNWFEDSNNDDEQYGQAPSLMPSLVPSQMPSPVPSQMPSQAPSQMPSQTQSQIPLQEATETRPKLPSEMGSNGLCVIGCTPYVDITNSDSGLGKYKRLVEDMAKDCDILVHVGDTKPGSMPCNRTLMTKTVHILKEAAFAYNKMALFALGDNDAPDCHRFASKGGDPVASDFYKAQDARQFIVDDLRLQEPYDLTGAFPVQNHNILDRTLYGMNTGFSCDFDKYVELDTFAVATMEVIGSHYYLDDERKNNYPKQDEVDPLEGRLQMFLNANECTLDWIEQSAAKASASNKRALFFLFHALFYTENGSGHKGNNGIGDYYNTNNLANFTNTLMGTTISDVYKPIFDKLTETALAYPDMMFYVVHADGHRYSTIRMNPSIDNTQKGDIKSHHNLMIHMVEGASRALTMYSKFTVHNESFQPVTLKEEWSLAAYKDYPYGHAWDPY